MPTDSVSLGPLSFSVNGSVLLFQAKKTTTPDSLSHDTNGFRSIRTLRVDLKDGSLGTLLAEPLPPGAPVVLGIIGMLKEGLQGGCVIALVSKAKQVIDRTTLLSMEMCHTL